MASPHPILGCHDVPLRSSSASSSSPCRLTVVVPPFQFIDRVLDIPVLPQRQIRTVQTVQQASDSTVQFLVWFLTRPLLRHVRSKGGDEDSRHAMAGVTGIILRAACTGTRPRGHVHRGHGLPFFFVQAAGTYGQTHISSTTSAPHPPPPLSPPPPLPPHRPKQQQHGSTRFVLLLFGDQVVEPGGRHDAAWRPRLRVAAKTASPALMVAT